MRKAPPLHREGRVQTISARVRFIGTYAMSASLGHTVH